MLTFVCCENNNTFTKYLSDISPHLQLALFDAWRPISVQKFMFNYTIQETCKEFVDVFKERLEFVLQLSESMSYH